MSALSNYYVNFQASQLQNGFAPMSSILCGCNMPTGSGRTWTGSSGRNSRLAKWALSTNACFANAPQPLGSCTYDGKGKLLGAIICAVRSVADSINTSTQAGSIVKTVLTDIASFLSSLGHKRDSVSGLISDSNSGKSAAIIGNSIQIELTGDQTTNLLGEVFPVFIENIPSSFQAPTFDVAVVEADGSFRFLNLNVKYSAGQLTVMSNYPVSSTSIYTPIAYDGALSGETTSRSGSSRLVSGLASNLVAVLV